MIKEKIRIKCAEIIGIKPRKLWCYWIDKEERTGSIKISSKHEAEIHRQKQIDTWQEWYGPLPNINT